MAVNYCILKVSSERERKCWIDALNEQIAFANELAEAEKATMMRTSEKEVAEQLFEKEDEDEEDIGLPKKTLSFLEDWKKGMEGRLTNLEKKISQTHTHTLPVLDNEYHIHLSYLQLFLIIVAAMIIGKVLFK